MRFFAISSVAVLAGIAVAATSIPAAAARAPRCPQFVTKYCVVTKAGVRETAVTNPCFAKERGERVLHLGACQGPICTFLYMPVCSLDPLTHMQRTYSNLCWSDVGDATFLHKGACKGQ